MKKSKRRPARPRSALAQVHAVLQQYATRGAFRSFAELPARGRKAAFRFNWFRDVPFTVTFDPPTRTLTFVDLLPEVPGRSPMDRDLRRFVAARESPSLPDHRRVDPRRIDVIIRNRCARVSIAFRLKAAHVEYGVRKSVNLVHEVFTDFLSDARFAAYQVEHFRLDPEMA
jgi:hypothetical protein